jgi:endoglucanase|eukprot:evm.model.NODE_31567_length_81678_cov_30.212677.26
MCFDLDVPLQWTSEEGELRVNGFPFHLKGISCKSTVRDAFILFFLITYPLSSSFIPTTHYQPLLDFGFETGTMYPGGLSGKTTVRDVFTLLRAEGFNALRIPFSAEIALNPNQILRVQDPDLDNLGHMARLAKFVDVAAEFNLLVMPDMHRLYANGGIDALWYDNKTPYSRLLEAWTNVMRALEDKWNFAFIDLKNEPHGPATWGNSNRATDWNKAAEELSKALFDRFPQWHGLTFVGGIEWGNSIQGMRNFPIDLGRPDWTRRVVYSPHVYGPDVYDRPAFNFGFPDNLPGIWESSFGFVESLHWQNAVVIGEWGGKYGRGPSGRRDKTWADTLAGWVVGRCLEDNFYWCVNPDSSDTGGILEDDWITPVQPKLDLLRRVQPHPSLLYWTPPGNAVCLSEGEYANPKCRRK